MKFSLRSLMTVAILAPPLLAGVWFCPEVIAVVICYILAIVLLFAMTWAVTFAIAKIADVFHRQ
jgi:hypothetical protein